MSTLSREKWNEERRRRRREPPENYEELTAVQKAVLDLAVFEGKVLVGGQRMTAYLSAAGLLCRKGILEREGATGFYKPTTRGLALYAARKKMVT